MLSSPYINHFLQPDTIIPGAANPQSWNRYSYVLNNPIRNTDPTGHKCVSEGEGDCTTTNGAGNIVPQNGAGGMILKPPTTTSNKDGPHDDPRDSTVRIGLGNSVDCLSNPGSCQGGLGTLVGDYSTIYTAWHTYHNLGEPTYFFYHPVPNADAQYVNMYPDMYEHINGTDVMIIHLPLVLDNFVPAEMAHPTFYGGEDVSVVYWDDNPQQLNVLETQVRTKNTFKPGMYGGTATTVYNPADLTIVDLNQYQTTFNHGDSGGGVFYNGYFVGINSRIDRDQIGIWMSFERP